MTYTVTDLIAERKFVEAPRWHQGRFWFSDLYEFAVLSAREDGSDLRVEVEVLEQPSGLAWLPDGRLLVVSMRDRKLLRREHDGTVVVHADLGEHTRGFCNEVIVDAAGRAYVGSFGFDLDNDAPMAPAAIHRVDPDGTVTEVAGDMWFPNGWVLTADNVLIVNETFGNRVSAFDLTEDGRLVNRRVWAQFGPLPALGRPIGDCVAEFVVQPDGMCIDADGALWIADLGARKLLRVVEGGEVVDEIEPGGMMPFAGALGGADGHPLFICAAPDFKDVDRRSTRLAKIMTARVPVGRA